MLVPLDVKQIIILMVGLLNYLNVFSKFKQSIIMLISHSSLNVGLCGL